MIVKKNPPKTRKNSLEQVFSRLFAEGLLQWNRDENFRQMPWKGEKDPYRIWLSEIILQQTRVEQGLKYYQNFISSFPDVTTLAQATDEKIMKLWEGLGYYSRCRNLIITARHISNDLGGVFPNRYEDILQLKGIGAYTAAAISSFAFNHPYAVLDGNVFRVISRIFDLDTPIDSAAGKKIFPVLAKQLLPAKRAGEYNQAIMDFGAMVCKPQPECEHCFFNRYCKGYLAGRQDLLPVKEKKLKIKKRRLNYFVIVCKGHVLIRQRTTKDIWQQLFEFLLMETEGSVKPKKLLELFDKQYAIKNYTYKGSFHMKQKLTHQYIEFSFNHLELSNKTSIPGFFWAKITDLHAYAFPKSLKQFIVSQLI